MILRPIIALVGCVAYLAACRSGAPERDRRSDQYHVYAAALDSVVAKGAAPIHVASRTWPYSLARALGDTSALYRAIRADTGVGPTLLRAFENSNESARALCACFPPGRTIQLVANDGQPEVAGPLWLSDVGFDAHRTRSLVAVRQTCGPLCSSFVVYLVVHRAGRWSVSRRVVTGAS